MAGIARPISDIGVSVQPLGRMYGYDRGSPVDRRYIDAFMDAHRADIHGHVMDIGDDVSARRFGHSLTHVDVLNPDPDAPGTTLVGDLETGAGVPQDAFDCVLVLETLNVIYDLRRAIEVVHDALRPGGVLLVTTNGVAPRDHQWEDYWRLTSSSLRRLLADVFGPDMVDVRSYGNVLSASAFLYGAAAEELGPAALDHHDPEYEVTIGGRAQRRMH